MHQLRLHGPPRVSLADGRDLRLSAREAALLAWLHQEGPTPRARIAGLLWPAGTEAQARANLRQLLARLRRSAGALIAETAGVLHLPVQVRAQMQGADEPSGTLLASLDFDDLPEFAQWLAARRDDALRRRQREGLARARERLDHGALDAALAQADALLAEQPESEEAWRLRMEALYQRGDRAAAIAAWDDCRNALRRAFGVAPSAATNALGGLILADAPALAGAPEGGHAQPPAQPPARLPALPPALPPTLPPALRRPAQLIGREHVLAGIHRALQLGRSVVVCGPGGIGKSRVLQQVADTVAPALRVSARPGDAVLAGSLLAQLVAVALESYQPTLTAATRRDLMRLLPDTGPALMAVPLRSDAEHRRVMGAVLRLLSACRAVGLRLLVLDDLQFADEASLGVLRFVLGHWLAPGDEHLAAAPLALVGARPDELSTTGHALVHMLTSQGRGSRVDVQPLSVHDLQQLLASLPLPPDRRQAWGEPGPAALAAALHTTVGGNPAFVLEALRNLFLDHFAGWAPGAALAVPATLRDSVRLRVQALADDALQLAQIAAVAQGDFDPGLAAAALQRPTLALAPLFAALETAQVFHGSGFSHDLVADAVRQSVPAALVAPLHRLVADHLVRRGGDDARVAYHLAGAGEHHAAVPWHLKAARAARSRWQLADAAQGFAAAARGLDPITERGAALAAWCDALRCWLGRRDLAPAEQALSAAAPLVQQVQERALLHARELRWLFSSRRLEEVGAVAACLVEELAASAELLEPDELVYGLRAATMAVQNGLAVAPVLALCERLRPMLGDAGIEVQAGFALARAALQHWNARPAEAAAALDAVWPLLDERCDPELRIAVANQLIRVRHALGDLPGALQLAEPLLDLLRQTGDDGILEADVLHIVGMMRVAHGQAAAGFQDFQAMAAVLHKAGEPMREAFALSISLACINVGRHAEAQDWLDHHAHAPGRPGFVLYDQALLAARARLAAARGEAVAPWADALAALRALPAGVARQTRVLLAGLQMLPLADIEALCVETQQRGQRGLQRTAEIAAARAAMAQGRADSAVQHARAALALAGCVDAWSDEPATVWLQAGEVLRACGAPAEGQAALAAGATWVQQGAARWADAVQRHTWCEGNPVHRALLRHGPPR